MRVTAIALEALPAGYDDCLLIPMSVQDDTNYGML
jgi:hypothetical protein